MAGPLLKTNERIAKVKTIAGTENSSLAAGTQLLRLIANTHYEIP
jgi:hypothetical protein